MKMVNGLEKRDVLQDFDIYQPVINILCHFLYTSGY